MAGKNIKGLTVKIGGDTTELGKALEGVDKKSKDLSSELGEINKLLKLDPKNTDLLAQKQKVLADAVGNTKEKLEKLKEAEKQVQKQFEKGEASEEQVRALQREIIATEKKLDGYEKAVKETSKALKGMDDANKDAEKSTDGLGTTMGNVAAGAAAALAAGVAAVVGGVVAAAEASREYRMAMAKLDTAFTMLGHSSEAATSTYKTLQGVLGDTDQAVEASNFLAQLCDNEEQLNEMTEALTGVYAMFGASLPLEGLAEAANESAKTGAVTGSLADALNWASISSKRWAAMMEDNSDAQAAFNKAIEEGANVEEAFSAALAACSTEQERAALITDALSGAYQEEAWAFKEANAEIIRANEANEQWASVMAEIGGAVEPILTDIKMMGASLVADLVPGVQLMAEAFRGVINGEDGAADQMGDALADILGGLVDKVVAIAPGLIEAAVGLVVSLTESLLTTLVENLPVLLEAVIAGASQIIASLGEMMPTLIPLLIDAVIMMAETLIDNIDLLIDAAIELVLGLADGIIEATPDLIAQIPVIIHKLVTAIIANLPKILAMGVELVVKLASGLVVAIPQLLAAIPEIIAAIIGGLVQGISKIGETGADLVRGLWNGIKDMGSWIAGKLKGFGDSILGTIKSFFGIKSPSRVFRDQVGAMLAEGLAVGIEENADAPLDAMTDLSEDLLGEADSLNGLTLERNINHAFSGTAAEQAQSGLLGKLDSILAAIERGQILTIDGKALVGATAGDMDNTLGQRRALAARGAL